ncbi:hypothetical protein Poli38472_013163 [Pythium oligandrum]|uniref:WD repeat-containing protein 60 n=1 Tax=Pythium oligandrum TaxID=41045 RepID=A0A8K1C348_PYTOL|nr:hypothetical protein Poli38472_013163 [Pythium oligandrum]|eukprot:TMW55272.1 hypothetical protein Poli38472_013163 [Pythium oligandrum]
MSTPHAEPKGPSSVDDGAPKKASKKTTAVKRTPAAEDGPSAAVAATVSAPQASASPVPMLRVPGSEPKPVEGADATKARSSKKRTSTTPPNGDGPPSGPSLGGGPTGAPSADAAAVAKSEADAEKERLRREAKKQRAKELEEQKRRDELAKQAIEEARRKEEERQREVRRQKELAALNANAEECNEEEDTGNDYDEDGFENYDDDFEADDAPPKPSGKPPVVLSQAKPQAKAKGVAPSTVDTNELKKIQQALQAESKELQSASRPSSSTKPSGDPNAAPSRGAQEAKQARSSSSIASSIAGLKQSLDPRAKRVKEILEARKLEVEKFNLFQQPPLTELDKYLGQLRRGQVRQAFVQTNEGARSMATQTKPPPKHDQSMHFPDDIGLETNAGSTKRAKARGRRSSNQTTDEPDDTGENEEDDDEKTTSTSSSRFFRFLEQAAYVCEILTEENTQDAESQRLQQREEAVKLSAKDSLSTKQLFPTKKFDQLALEKALASRILVGLRFSPAVSNLFLTTYSAPVKENNDEPSPMADKSLSCVWDVNALDESTLFVLQNEGEATACCLGPSRELFALVGTDDGSVHVWDLRSRLSIAGATQVKTEGGMLDVYAPTYSTCAAGGRLHNSAIVAVEVVSAPGAGSFQFGSLDDRGVLVIWSVIDFTPGDDALLADKCVEIGGRIKLVVNTVIDTQQAFLMLTRPTQTKKPSLVRRDSSNSKPSQSTTQQLPAPVGPIATVLQFDPQDSNQFFIGTITGLVLRGHRFEKTGAMAGVSHYRRDRSHMEYSRASVVCIAFHPTLGDYFLVGYADGAVCLFHCDSSIALTTWEEVDFGRSISCVQWSTSRPGVFLASYSHGELLAWDLTVQTSGPVFSLQLPRSDKEDGPITTSPSMLYPFTLSSERMRTSRPAIAMQCGGEPPFQFQLQELSASFTTSSRHESTEVKQILASIL